MKTFIYGIARWMAVAAMIAVLIFSAGSASSVSNANPQDVWNAVYQSADITNMQSAPNQIIKRFYGIDPSDYEFCALYYPLSNMDVDELLVVKYRDASQAESLIKAAEARLAGQKSVFESYGVGQMESLTNHSLIDSRSGFVIFAVNPKDSEIHEAFIKATEGASTWH